MKILLASSIHKQAIEQLELEHDVVTAFNGSEEVLKEAIADRQILVFRSGVQITADVMSQAPDLQLIMRAGSGVDNIDLDYVNERGIPFVRIPGPGAKAVAELSFAMMLALSRHLLRADRLTRQGHWAKPELTGYSMTGKVLGIIGAGNIGSRTGTLGNAWGMRVIGCVEEPTAAKKERLAEQGIELVTCDEVLAQADYVSIHVPLQASTRNLVGAAELARMKQGAILVNLSRGGVVDEMALHDALASGHLRGAGLDVHVAEGEGKVSPLADLPNVVLTPHIGAGSFDSQREIGEIVLARVSELTATFDNERAPAGVAYS